MSTVAELFARLDGDAWRVRHPFSDDILQTNALLTTLRPRRKRWPSVWRSGPSIGSLVSLGRPPQRNAEFTSAFSGGGRD